MYFYIGRNGRFYENLHKTDAFLNAQIRIVACFNENMDLVIYDIKRKAGTELSQIKRIVTKIVYWACSYKSYNVTKVINQTNKLPNSVLHKIGFETVDGCTLFKIS
jgi:hypothetical protein